MPGQSYIVVDGSLADAITEYASILDLYNKELNYVEKLSSFVVEGEDHGEDDDEDVEFKDEVYSEIQESYKYLSAVPDRDFESVANLVVYILTFSNEFKSHLKSFLINLINHFKLNDVNAKIIKDKKKTLKITSIISILSNIFNLIESNDLNFKNFILKIILNLIEILNNGLILLPIVSNIENWLIKDIELQSLEIQQESRLLILQFAKIISSIDEIKSLNLFKLAITKIPNTNSNLINQFLIENLNSEKILDLSNILQLEVVIKNHQESKFFLQLLQNYLTLTTQEFENSLSQFESISSIINKDVLLRKNQFLTLLKLASTKQNTNNNNNSINYNEISSTTNIPIDEVELFIIDAIKLGIIEGKLSQINQSFQIYKVNLIIKQIELSDWIEIKEKLLEWRSKLKNVESLIDQASKRKIKA